MRMGLLTDEPAPRICEEDSVVPANRSLALVLRTVEVFETSLVVTLFTRELGKVSVLAKGARRLKSPFQGGLDLLGVSDIVMLHKASESLDLLTEAAPVERFRISSPRSGGPVCRLLHRRTAVRPDRPPRPAPQAVRRGEDHLAASGRRRIAAAEGPPVRAGVPARAGSACRALDQCAHCGDAGRHRGRRGVRAGDRWSALRGLPARPAARRDALGHDLEAIRVLASPGRAWRELAFDPSPAALAAGPRDRRRGHQSCPGPSPPSSGPIWESDPMALVPGTSVASRDAGSRCTIARSPAPVASDAPSSGRARTLRRLSRPCWPAPRRLPELQRPARPVAGRLRSRPRQGDHPGRDGRHPAREGREPRTCSTAGSPQAEPRTRHADAAKPDPSPPSTADPRLRRLAADAKPKTDPEADKRVRAPPTTLFQQGKLAEAEKAFAADRQESQGDPLGREGPVSTSPRPSSSARSTSMPTTASRSSVADYPGTEYLDKLVSREYAIAQIWLAQADPKAKPEEKLCPGTRRFDGQQPLHRHPGARASRPSSTSATTTRPARWPTTPCSRSPTIT